MTEEARIKAMLKYDIDLTVTEIVTSTNTLMKERAAHAPQFCLIAAHGQTAGRGRLGRSFYSPNGSGVYMSMLLKPQCTEEAATRITTCCAVAMCRVLERVGNTAVGIKWVNDIYTSRGKVCGILTEGGRFPSDGEFYAVVGIGVNLSAPRGGFPHDIEKKAATLFDEPPKDIFEKTVAEFVNTFIPMYQSINDKAYMREYIDRSVILGKRIELVGKNKTARAVGINEDFSLKVQYDDGVCENIFNGDVSIIPLE